MDAKQYISTQTTRDTGTLTSDRGSSDATQNVLGQAGEVVIVERPATGRIVEIPVSPDRIYLLDFPAEQASVEVDSSDLTLTFDDNGDGIPDSRLVFVDLVTMAEGGEAPVFQLGEVWVDAQTLIDRAIALAGSAEAPLEDIAAGPGQNGGGVFSYSDDVGSTIDLLSGSSVIGGTTLQFDTPEPDDDEAIFTFGTDGDALGGPAGDRMNLALILDTSGSMKKMTSFDGEQITRVDALDRTVEQMLDDLSAAGSSQFRVHMVNFAEGVKEAATFDIVVDGTVDSEALQDAKDFILAPGEDPLIAGLGYTNYEAGFDAAVDWFGDGANTLDDPNVNQTFFVSDGEPNRSYAGDSDGPVIAPGSAQDAVDHVLGQANVAGASPDTVSEFDILSGPFKGVENAVDAIGLNIDSDAQAILDQIDGDGSAGNINSSNALVVSAPPAPASTAVAGPGDDTLASSLTS